MWAAPFAEPLGDTFEDQPLGNGYLAQGGDVRFLEQARIEVRQQAGLLEHATCGRSQIGQCRLMPEPIKLGARGAVAKLGFVTERKQRFLATRRLTGARYRQHVLE